MLYDSKRYKIKFKAAVNNFILISAYVHSNPPAPHWLHAKPEAFNFPWCKFSSIHPPKDPLFTIPLLLPLFSKAQLTKLGNLEC